VTLRRVATRLAGSYRIFDVLEHDMQDEEGRPLGAFTTVRCPDWVSMVPITDAGEVVLVRQYRHGIDAPTLEVPGGVIDPGEAPAHAAVRELAEETGYAPGIVEPLGWTHPNPPIQSNRHFTFLARGARRVGDAKLDPLERCELVLRPLGALRAALRTGDDPELTHALVLVSLQRAFDRLDGLR
jgi:8-oxo-dGTP pyrophosphatase MutT (NUDIX family)